MVEDGKVGFTVGIDWADKKSTVCVLNPDGRVVERCTIGNEARFFDGLLRRYRGAKCGIETGPFDRMVSESCARNGVEVFIADPTRIRPFLESFSQNKSDKKDADGIAELLRTSVKLFNPIVRRPQRCYELGQVILAREYFSRCARGAEAKLRKIGAQYGYRFPFRKDKEYGKRVRSMVKSAPKVFKDIAVPLTRAFDLNYSKREAANKEMEKRLRRDFGKEVALLVTIPGVSLRTVAPYLAWLGDVKRFDDAKDVAAFFGITPKTKRSGQKEVNLKITKRGNKVVRTKLVNAAKMVMTISADTELRRFGRRILGDSRDAKSYGKALVAVAHKLAVVMAAMLRDGKPYAGVYGDDKGETIEKFAAKAMPILEANKWSVKKAAAELGISAPTLRYRMEKAGLSRKEYVRRKKERERAEVVATLKANGWSVCNAAKAVGMSANGFRHRVKASGIDVAALIREDDLVRRREVRSHLGNKDVANPPKTRGIKLNPYSEPAF